VKIETHLFQDDFWRLSEEKKAVALSFVGDRRNCRQAWEATGFAVECALKAYIMRARGLNVWPDDRKSPLWTHDLRSLLDQSGLSIKEESEGLLASWMTVLTWRREHAYSGGRFPRKIAAEMVKAAFGTEGVVQWLKSQKSPS